MSTGIEWTNETWNPVVGCTRASAGCDNCYAVKMSYRQESIAKAKQKRGEQPGLSANYIGLTVLNGNGARHFNGTVRTVPDVLSDPLRWKKPRRVFVNSMSDLFHKDVPFEFIDKVFAVMNATNIYPPNQNSTPGNAKRWHTYQILTKRPERMAEYLESRNPKHYRQGEHPLFKVRGEVFRGQGTKLMNAAGVIMWPLSNVWLGTSIESDDVLHRLDKLRQCSAAVRFLSCEPLIAPLGDLDLTGIDWVIVGGESGHGARPMHPDWMRSIRDDCQNVAVPFFFKQWGAYTADLEDPELDRIQARYRSGKCSPDLIRYFDGMGRLVPAGDGCTDEGMLAMYRVGKKAAGRLLDGREWNEFPQTESEADHAN